MYNRIRTQPRRVNNNNKKKSRKFLKLWKFQRPLLGVPVDRFWWGLNNHSRNGPYFNPVPEFTSNSKVGDWPNVTRSFILTSSKECFKKKWRTITEDGAQYPNTGQNIQWFCWIFYTQCCFDFVCCWKGWDPLPLHSWAALLNTFHRQPS